MHENNNNVKLESDKMSMNANFDVLDKMNETMQVPREDTSQYAPRIISMMVPVDKIRTVIGSGGKTINAIIVKFLSFIRWFILVLNLDEDTENCLQKKPMNIRS